MEIVLLNLSLKGCPSFINSQKSPVFFRKRVFLDNKEKSSKASKYHRGSQLTVESGPAKLSIVAVKTMQMNLAESKVLDECNTKLYL